MSRWTPAQAAMEYLMTYGWAILIVAIVLGALYQLGILNVFTFVGKAAPGSCMVERPYGQFTTQQISLSGVCTQLPQEVAELSGTDYITTPTALLDNVSDFTVTFWVDPSSVVNQTFYEEGYADCPLLTVSGSPLALNVSNNGSWVSLQSNDILKTSEWQFVAVTLKNGGVGTGTATMYVDGGDAFSGASQMESGTGGTLSGLIGGTSLCPGMVGSFGGLISNVQVYNDSLSQNGIVALYQEGLGGAPIDLHGLLAWWPLNSDANDYSGDYYNGNSSMVAFTGSWTGAYSMP